MGEQLRLEDAATRVPGRCASELRHVDMGKTHKSLCSEMGLWTNCRDWGACVADKRGAINEHQPSEHHGESD